MHFVSRFIAGFIIGFLRVWQISLVTLAIVPLIAIAGGLYAYVTFGLIAKVRKSYLRAGEIAQEVRSYHIFITQLTFDNEYETKIYSHEKVEYLMLLYTKLKIMLSL